MKVVIIGSGNVATVFGRKIIGAGHEIVQLVGRNENILAENASVLKTVYTCKIHDINLLADIYIIAVSDIAIADIAANLSLNNKLVVHTAAAVSKEAIAKTSSKFGVLYPLQSLKRNSATQPVIPILIDGNTSEVRADLIQFASSWADNVTIADDVERLKLHLAAVFVNNFTNHLFAIGKELCFDNNLNFNVLFPIIEETIAGVIKGSPSQIQTGPAVRNDVATLEKHRSLLREQPSLLNVYNVLTESIISFTNKNIH